MNIIGCQIGHINNNNTVMISMLTVTIIIIIIADVSFLNQLVFNWDTDLEHSPQHKLDSDLFYRKLVSYYLYYRYLLIWSLWIWAQEDVTTLYNYGISAMITNTADDPYLLLTHARTEHAHAQFNRHWRSLPSTKKNTINLHLFTPIDNSEFLGYGD